MINDVEDLELFKVIAKYYSYNSYEAIAIYEMFDQLGRDWDIERYFKYQDLDFTSDNVNPQEYITQYYDCTEVKYFKASNNLIVYEIY